VKAHTFNELQTALNDIRDIKDSKNQQTKIKEL
jgi:hypothetical protein